MQFHEPTTRRIADDLLIDLEHDCLILRGQPLELGRRAFALVRFLYEHWPAQYQATQLLETVWDDVHVGENTVHQTARRIHRQLEARGLLEIIDIEGSHSGYRLLLPKRRKVQEEIERVVLTENRAIAMGVSGTELWSFEFPARLRRFSSAELEWRVQRIDLSGDGDLGVAIAASFRETGPPDIVFYLLSDGVLQWKTEALPDLMDRGGGHFELAWHIRSMIPVATQRGPEVWVALANDAGWAGCILRFDRDGAATVQFANSGFVERIAQVTLSSGEQAVIAAGETNAFEQAFVALLGVNDPPSRSLPGDILPRYRYENAPEGNPRKYILFPNTELIRSQRRPYGHVQNLAVFPGRVLVEVETGPEGAFLRYHFSEELDPVFVFPSGNHEYRHKILEEEGKIAHSWRKCPELDAPLVLDVWERATGWQKRQIPWRDLPWKEG